MLGFKKNKKIKTQNGEAKAWTSDLMANVRDFPLSYFLWYVLNLHIYIYIYIGRFGRFRVEKI